MRRLSTAFAVFTFTFVVTSLVAAWLLVQLPPRLAPVGEFFKSDAGVVVFFALKLSLCLAAGIVAGYLATRRFTGERTARPTTKRVSILRAVLLLLAGLFLLGFFVTWVVGVPQVISYLDAEAVERYKEVRAGPPLRIPWDPSQYPRFETSLAFPIAPGVVLTLHEYLVDPTYGAGIIQVHTWCFGQPHRLFAMPLWLS